MAYCPVNWEEAMKKECRRRKYSERTIETYLFCINKFLNFSGKEIGKISKKDALDFLYFLEKRGKSGSTLNVYLMAIKFFMEEILRKNIHLNIKYSRIPEKLPYCLSKEDVKKLIDNIANHKHKIMITLMYGAGLRVSELVNLKVGDLNLKEKYGFVRQGKGNKDRIFIIANKLQRVLIQLIAGRNIEEYLFLTNRNENYNISSLQKIVKDAAKKSGLDWRKIHCHTLRHSFATHLIEQGQSISEVQSLLGHKSPETTQVYLHTASAKMLNIKSPIDNL